MVDWAALQGAYGSAEGIPDLLRAAEASADDFGDDWDAVWSELCHQGTVYTASYAAIPALAAMSLRQQPRGYMAPLQLAGAIIASNDGPPEKAEVRQRYSAEIAQMRTVAEQTLPLAKDDTEFIYALETLMAFENGGVWQRSLNYLPNGEAPIECPNCAEPLRLHIEDIPATVDAYGFGSTTTVEPAAPEARSIAERLVALSVANDHQNVADRLPFLFGTTTCPECNAGFAISSALS